MNKIVSKGMQRHLLFAIICVALSLNNAFAAGDGSRFPDTPVPLKIDEVPKRPKPLIEWGDTFLGRGNIKKGVKMPGGAVWQPSFMVFGTLRSAFQSQHYAGITLSEWVNRLDLFANLQLSATERILIGFRPLDRTAQYTGYTFEPEFFRGWDSHVNGNIRTLFFEGEIGELFPNLDRKDFKKYDVGFAIGRQPFLLQDGMLVTDTMDGIGVTFNNLHVAGASNHQLTFIAAFRNIHRGDNIRDDHSRLFGVTSRVDWSATTMDADLVYVLDRRGDSDGIFWGLAFTQRINHFATTFRCLGSKAMRQDSPKMDDGIILFSEVSWTPAYTHDHFYFNSFWGIGKFRSAARGPEAGGPMGRTGLLFSSADIGSYGPPLSNTADDAVGGVFGYQRFFASNKRQVVLELGGRGGTRSGDSAAAALGGRYQQAFGQHVVLVLDAFAQKEEHRNTAYGARVEGILKF